MLGKKLPVGCPGIPVGVEVRPPPNTLPVGADVNPLPKPPPTPAVVVNIVARKGFAAPAIPVACGRRPVPSPVGCDPRESPLPSDPVGLCFDRSGVVGADWGMGGSDSSSAAPNEEEGLKAFMPEKPVVCGCSVEGVNAEGEEVLVAPVGCMDSEENTEFENVEPDVVGDAGFAEVLNSDVLVLIVGLVDDELLLVPVENDDATFDIKEPEE